MIKATGEFIAIELINEEEKRTESGIIIHEEKRKRDGDIVFCKRGRVLNWGNSVDLEVAAGDIVLFNPYDIGVFEDCALINYKLIKGIVTTD